MARRTKAEAERTREAVLDAAARVFLERGVARATLEEVGRVAGVTRGAVYWHFSDKLDLFLALEGRAHLPAEDFSAKLSALAADPSLDPLDELARAVEECLVWLEGDVDQRRLLTVLLLRCEYTEEMAPALDRQRHLDEAVRAEFGHLFRLAATRGRLAPTWRPEAAALAFLHLINGMVQAWLRRPVAGGLAIEGAEMVRAFLASVGGAAQPHGAAAAAP
jgi:TetR/AcrR family acrAB operon transcriptional repressor